MGITMSLESDVTEPCPLWFEHSDSKSLVDFLLFERVFGVGNSPDIIGLLEQRLGVSLDPILQPDEAEFEWTPAPKFATTLNAFARALATTPNALAGIQEPYFVEGFFASDLEDLRKMAEWHLAHGATKMRLSAD